MKISHSFFFFFYSMFLVFFLIDFCRFSLFPFIFQFPFSPYFVFSSSLFSFLHSASFLYAPLSPVLLPVSLSKWFISFTYFLYSSFHFSYVFCFHFCYPFLHHFLFLLFCPILYWGMCHLNPAHLTPLLPNTPPKGAISTSPSLRSPSE